MELLAGNGNLRLTTKLNDRDRDPVCRYKRLVSGALPFVNPERRDHIDAAALRNQCRRSGVQIGTIDALLAQLCIRNKLTLLSTDKDFDFIAAQHSLRLWR